MSKRALVVLAPGFEEMEAIAPIDILRRAGVEVVVAGVDSLEITGSHNVTITCDALINEVGTDFAAIILPGGGQGAINLRASWDVNEKLLMIANSGGIIAAICASPAVVLCSTGLLEGRKAVCYPSVESECPHVTFANQRVCVDSTLITAQGPDCAIEFALAIVECLVGREKRNEIARDILFTR